MTTFLLFVPASTRWLGWRKTENPLRDRLGRFCDIYCTVILRYAFALRVISDIFESSERYGPSAYNCVYVNTWRVCQTRVHKSLIEPFARHSFCLFGGIRLSPQRTKTSESTASFLFITSRTMDNYRNSPTDVLLLFKKGLERASVNWSNLWISKAYFPANKMNSM